MKNGRDHKPDLSPMIIADTGFFIAILDRQDSDHEKAVACLKDMREPLITTWPVLTETTHLLLHRGGIINAIKFISHVLGGACEIYDIPKLQQKKIIKLMSKYRDLPMDLADASLVMLAEHLGHGRILSTDRRDFHSYRWKERKPFENLLA
jgi:uncharacterized protein